MYEDFNNEGTSNTTETTTDNSYNYYGEVPAEPQKESKGLAIASMVLGIVAIIFGCCGGWIGLVCGIVGLILGIVYNKKNEKNGMATAGIVCSIIGLILFVVMNVLAIGLLSSLGISSFQDYVNMMNQ